MTSYIDYKRARFRAAVAERDRLAGLARRSPKVYGAALAVAEFTVALLRPYPPASGREVPDNAR